MQRGSSRCLYVCLVLVSLGLWACGSSDGGSGGGGGGGGGTGGSGPVGRDSGLPLGGQNGGCEEDTRRCGATGAVEVCRQGVYLEIAQCPEGQTCEAGRCETPNCVPACEGRQCGTDGCGGECGRCEAGAVCGADSVCVAAPASCGDGTCSPEANENCGVCPADCGNCCGNAECEPERNENCATCLADCACAEPQRCDADTRTCQGCSPQCAGRVCGDDTCGGDCGECAAGEMCTNGQCEAACVPQCAGRACGEDGCGGDCGTCDADLVCGLNGQCAAPPARCGDNVCGAGEDCGNCPADCGLCCGNGMCQRGIGENCATCPADCACAADEVCDPRDRVCVVGCEPACDGRTCGADGCGGSCGDCAVGEVCGAGGRCGPAPAQCGDGRCGAGEDCANCAFDCGDCCGNDQCQDALGENCSTCAADCACEGGEVCDPARRVCAPVCVAQCDGRNCGDNGCGGVCGACGGAQACVEGVCRDVCVPQCDGRECGGDGCNGSCGGCAAEERCVAGQCTPLCVPTCFDLECGGDGCGGICGECGPGEDCVVGDCLAACQPVCAGRVCGDDGCGTSCGECAPGSGCVDGRCIAICVPRCDGLACGDNGCGGVCGECADGEGCRNGRCVSVAGCNCLPAEVCLEGACRNPDQLCSPENPNGLCESGQDCLAGACVDAGRGCSAQNPVGVCPLGEICRNGACEPLDDAALCDDANACTRDFYDALRNRCFNETDDALACSDGNGCTTDTCSGGVCQSQRVAGCIEPPTLDPYSTPTNVGMVQLSGSKPAGSAIEINGQGAVPENPDARFTVRLNLQPGLNVYEIRSVDRGQRSESITARIVFDISPPNTRINPAGGTFLSGVTVTVAADEAARVYYTDDGGTPDQWSQSFLGTRTFRIFDSTTLRFRARDPAGNWEAAPVGATYEITGRGNGWDSRTTLPEPRSLAAVASDGTRLFVLGGTDGNAPQAGAYRYDSAADAWTNLPALAFARTQAAAVVLGGNVYLLGGENDGLPLNLVERVNGLNPGAWAAVRAMPTTRFGLAAVATGNRIYALGGKTNGGAVLSTFEVYDVNANSWANNVAPLPRPRFAFAAVLRDNKIYCFGGEDERGVPIPEVDVYDIATNQWAQAADLPTPRAFLAADVMDNLGQVGGQHRGIVVAGGRLADGRGTPVVEEFFPGTGEWRSRTPLPQGTYGAGAGFIDIRRSVDTLSREVWFVGGQNTGGLTEDVLAYHHDLDWTKRLQSMPEGRFLEAAVTLDDQIFVLGGRHFQETVAGWRFDPETGAYVNLPDLPRVQNGLVAAAVDGVIYAIGGQNGFGIAVPFVHAYDPATGAWVQRRPMPTARSEAAIAVNGHEIYVVGGENNGPSQAVEIYDTRTDTWRNGPLLPEPRKGAVAVQVDGDLYVFGGLIDANSERTSIVRLRNGNWAAVPGTVSAVYGAAAAVQDAQVMVVAGRRANALSNATYRYNVTTGIVARNWLANTELLTALDRRPGAYLHGRLYLMGGNAGGAMVGPGGESTVELAESECFNGRLDVGEGLGANLIDAGGQCGLVDGCAAQANPQASALARCQADGFACQVGPNGILGLRNGAGQGSDCNNEDSWRIYCYGNGAVNWTCGTVCAVGEMRTGHSPCNCNVPGRLFSRWCD